VDYLYGALNYQIEHHFFPGVARHNMREAHAIVKAFCIEKGIPYHETGIVQSYVEIVQYLNDVTASVRAEEQAAVVKERSKS
ncbi:MAG: acyl-CoA desaturase, partial [Chloroflexi bacterium]|nr:acyl-CoA desaturase [Chloroflexota bacterium]